MARPLDTSAAALEQQRAAFRRLTPSQRLDIAVRLSDDVRALAAQGARRRRPSLTTDEVEAEVGRIMSRASQRSVTSSRA